MHCSTCRWFDAKSAPTACHRFPPPWRPVGAEDWCGEHAGGRPEPISFLPPAPSQGKPASCPGLTGKGIAADVEALWGESSAPVPNKPSLSQFQAAHPRIGIGQGERDAWQAMLDTHGADRLSEAYHAIAPAFPAGQRLFLATFGEWMDTQAKKQRQAARNALPAQAEDPDREPAPADQVEAMRAYILAHQAQVRATLGPMWTMLTKPILDGKGSIGIIRALQARGIGVDKGAL